MNKILLIIISSCFLSCVPGYHKPFYITCENLTTIEFIEQQILFTYEVLDASTDTREIYYWLGVCETLENLQHYIELTSSSNSCP